MGGFVSPVVPRDWNGTRITLVTATFWPDVTRAWTQLQAPLTADSRWSHVRRGVFIQCGEWCVG
jgi:hypothetical protein